MTSLIEQLQRDAADPDISLSTLLRRAKIAAAKLGLDKLEQWMEFELRGYPSGSEMPPYRKLSGEVRALNPFHGWIPVQSDSPEIIEIISEVDCHESVGQIEELIQRSDGGFVRVPFGPKKVALMQSMSNIALPRYEIHLSITLMTRILDEVRNALLDWALGLEKAGVVGGEFSFSTEDKRIAQNSPFTLNVGAGSSLVGLFGSHNTAGNITANIFDLGSVAKIVATLDEHRSSFEASGADPKKLRTAIAELKKELQQKEPHQAKLAAVLSDVRSTLAGCVGNLLASGIVYEISRIIH